MFEQFTGFLFLRVGKFPRILFAGMFLIICDDREEFVRVIHQVFVLAIHQPVVEFNELVHDEWRDVQVGSGVDGHVEEDSLNLAQDLVDSISGVLEKSRGDIDLVSVQQRSSLHRSQFVPLVDDLNADADSLEPLVDLSQVFKHLKIQRNQIKLQKFPNLRSLPSHESIQSTGDDPSAPGGCRCGSAFPKACCRATTRGCSCAPTSCGGYWRSSRAPKAV